MEFNSTILKEDDIITTKTIHKPREFKPSDILSESEITPCPDCNSTERVVDSQRAEVTCARCGLVLDESIMDRGPEWRAFDHEQRDNRARTGAPATYAVSDKGLTTDIDWKNVDAKGHRISDRNKAQWYRLRRWQKRNRISRTGERNLAIALGELHRISSNLGLQKPVREDASLIYRNAAKRNLVRGRSIEGVVATSVYIACRRFNIPRTLNEVSEASQVSKKQIAKNHRFLSRELNIKLKPTSPADYIPRFASKLGLSSEAESKAIEIVNNAMEDGLNSGKGPSGLAAAALYIASVLMGERKTQKSVADISGVTEVTIRNRYKELTEQLEMGVSI